MDTHQLLFLGDIDTQTEGCHVDEVGEGLERGVEPDYTRERREADDDGAGREKDDEGERGESAVGD
jgi:hypothetical protein